jgi:hypothetical protein
MRTKHYLIPLIAAAGAAAAFQLAPLAAADPTAVPNAPDCTTVAGNQYTGTGTTECQTPGNVQIDATAPQAPDYGYPFDDDFFYGPGLILGGNNGPHGGGGGGGGHR